jgi:hypothetical protein
MGEGEGEECLEDLVMRNREERRGRDGEATFLSPCGGSSVGRGVAYGVSW